MQLSQALDQISEIHGHLDRTEVYRGLRPLTVAFSGLLALAAAALAPRLLGPEPGLAFLACWLGVAAASVAACAADVARSYWLREDASARRRTRRLLGQFAPCLAVGLAVTAAVAVQDASYLHLLPGLWAAIFSLGLFAARPYLPRSTGWVALYYLAAGMALLLAPSGPIERWGMGLAFGPGQLALAAVLHRHVEREGNHG
jgi:hypothetical protein